MDSDKSGKRKGGVAQRKSNWLLTSGSKVRFLYGSPFLARVAEQVDAQDLKS